MASGGYPNFHSSASGHRGGGHGSRRGRPLSNFRSRGRGKELLHHQKPTDQSIESDNFFENEQNTESITSLHDPTVVSGISSHRGRGGHLRARGRGSRRPHDTRHGKDEANSKYIDWAE